VAPVLIINPRTDEQFVDDVNEQSVHAATAEDLARALRAQYPNVLVRPRELDGERTQVWYVYREGRWVDPISGGRRDVNGQEGR
jgi:hypothetical protein